WSLAARRSSSADPEYPCVRSCPIDGVLCAHRLARAIARRRCAFDPERVGLGGARRMPGGLFVFRLRSTVFGDPGVGLLRESRIPGNRRPKTEDRRRSIPLPRTGRADTPSPRPSVAAGPCPAGILAA